MVSHIRKLSREFLTGGFTSKINKSHTKEVNILAPNPFLPLLLLQTIKYSIDFLFVGGQKHVDLVFTCILKEKIPLNYKIDMNY